MESIRNGGDVVLEKSLFSCFWNSINHQYQNKKKLYNGDTELIGDIAKSITHKMEFIGWRIVCDCFGKITQTLARTLGIS
jgi:hypothetical protein